MALTSILRKDMQFGDPLVVLVQIFVFFFSYFLFQRFNDGWRIAIASGLSFSVIKAHHSNADAVESCDLNISLQNLEKYGVVSESYWKL